MTALCSPKIDPFLLGMFSSWLLVGCGGQESVPSQPTAVRIAAQINQHDVDSFTNAINLTGCTFVVAAEAATFTPSAELSQMIYGDPNGRAHKLGFSVPKLASGGASIVINNLQVELANTGLTLSGSTATVQLGFDGLLHASFPVPVIGQVNTDIRINSSRIAVALIYDPMTERARASDVSSSFDIEVKNCGILGFCNSIVENYLKTHLASMVEAPLRDVLTKALDSAEATARLDGLVIAGYNRKDQQATPWTMVPSTLNIAADAVNFTAERMTP